MGKLEEELKAIKQIEKALQPLNREAKQRIMVFVAQHLNQADREPAMTNLQQQQREENNNA